MKTTSRFGLFGNLLLSALTALPLTAAVVPVDLPAPEPADKGVKNKPVKVYIQSGQSNSLGFGRIEGAEPFYSQVFLSADPSVTEGTLPADNAAILRFGVFQSEKPDAPAGGAAKVFKGAYDAKADYTQLTPASTESVALGTVNAKLPSIEGPHTIVVDAFLEVPHDGSYQLHPGTGVACPRSRRDLEGRGAAVGRHLGQCHRSTFVWGSRIVANSSAKNARFPRTQADIGELRRNGIEQVGKAFAFFSRINPARNRRGA